MIDEFQLIDLKLNGKPLSDCKVALECNSGNYRLYVDIIEGSETFYALAVEFVSCDSDCKNWWDSPSLTVSPLFNVTAYFDGVRHLEFKRECEEMAGYIYYPNMECLLQLMQKVHEIEKKICRVEGPL